MLTLEDFEKNWEEAGRFGSVEERLARTERWMPFYAYMAEKQAGRPFGPGHAADHFVSVLRDAGYLEPSFSVLDIGAGAGGYSLVLAPLCSSLTALDPCRENLDLLRSRADQLGLGNVSCVNSPWELYSTDETFDLVITAMCPAVCSRQELLKMESLSKGRCAVVTVMPGSVDPHRRRMMQELGIRPSGMVSEAKHYYNVLYHMGRCPEVFCHSMSGTSVMTRERLLDHYTHYFKIFGVGEERSEAFLNEYFDRFSENGELKEQSRMEMALITWKV